MEQHGPSCPQRHEQQALTAHQLIQRALNTINELDQLGALKLEEATVCRSVLVVARARLLRKYTRIAQQYRVQEHARAAERDLACWWHATQRVAWDMVRWARSTALDSVR